MALIDTKKKTAEVFLISNLSLHPVRHLSSPEEIPFSSLRESASMRTLSQWSLNKEPLMHRSFLEVDWPPKNFIVMSDRMLDLKFHTILEWVRDQHPSLSLQDSSLTKRRSKRRTSSREFLRSVEARDSNPILVFKGEPRIWEKWIRRTHSLIKSKFNSQWRNMTRLMTKRVPPLLHLPSMHFPLPLPRKWLKSMTSSSSNMTKKSNRDSN